MLDCLSEGGNVTQIGLGYLKTKKQIPRNFDKLDEIMVPKNLQEEEEDDDDEEEEEEDDDDEEEEEEEDKPLLMKELFFTAKIFEKIFGNQYNFQRYRMKFFGAIQLCKLHDDC